MRGCYMCSDRLIHTRKAVASICPICGEHSTFGVMAGQEFDRAEPVIFVLPVRFKIVLSVHAFGLVKLHFSEFVAETRGTSSCHGVWIRRSSRQHRTTDYATVLLPLPGISNDLEVVRLL